MRHAESLAQRAVVAWARLHPVARKLFAIPNGGKRGKLEASILKGEGVLAGTPDLMLPVACGGCHGLFVEMKSDKGRLTPEQKNRSIELAADGYAVVAAHGVAPAIEAVTSYLAGRLKPGTYTARP